MRQATRHDCLPSLLANGEKWSEKVYGEEKKYFVLGRLEQPRQDKNLLYQHDEPNEPSEDSLSPHLPQFQQSGGCTWCGWWILRGQPRGCSSSTGPPHPPASLEYSGTSTNVSISMRRGGVSSKLAIYSPMIYTAPCIMSFLGPKWHLSIGSMPFHRAQKISISRAHPPPTCPRNGCCPHQKHYAQGRINHRCIGGFMYKSPRGRFQGPYCGGWGSKCIKELDCPARGAQVHKGT